MCGRRGRESEGGGGRGKLHPARAWEEICRGRGAEVKRPLIREDLKVIQYQSQEADNTFITSDGTSPYNSTRKWVVKRHYREDNNQHPHNDINYEEGVIRVLCHTELLAGDHIHRQGSVQDGTSTQRLRERSLDLPL